MSSSTTPCCVVSLNQQQQENIQQHHQSTEEASVTRCKARSNKCTVVENGRVVVKSITTAQECRDSSEQIKP